MAPQRPNKRQQQDQKPNLSSEVPYILSYPCSGRVAVVVAVAAAAVAVVVAVAAAVAAAAVAVTVAAAGAVAIAVLIEVILAVSIAVAATIPHARIHNTTSAAAECEAR